MILERFESSRRNGSSSSDPGYSSICETGQIASDVRQDDEADQRTSSGGDGRTRAGQATQNGSETDTVPNQTLAADSQGNTRAAFVDHLHITSVGFSGTPVARVRRFVSVGICATSEAEHRESSAMPAENDLNLDERFGAAEPAASDEGRGVHEYFDADAFSSEFSADFPLFGAVDELT